MFESYQDFFNIITWRGLAENCGRYLAKGRKVAVDGRLQNRIYEDKDGIKRYVTDIVAENVEFLTPQDKEEKSDKPIRPQQQAIEGYEPPKRKHPPLIPADDEELPF